MKNLIFSSHVAWSLFSLSQDSPAFLLFPELLEHQEIVVET